MSELSEKKKRGRPLKPGKKVPLMVKITPESRLLIESEAQKTGAPLSHVVEKLIKGITENIKTTNNGNPKIPESTYEAEPFCD